MLSEDRAASVIGSQDRTGPRIEHGRRDRSHDELTSSPGLVHEAHEEWYSIYRIRYRAYSLPKKEFQGMNLALRST
jgi:hypothetical protein